jgi:hypothetical protein
MAPYLEDASRWADFHPTFIVTLRRHLSRLVSPHFHVDIREQVYLTEPGDEERRRIAPDVFVTIGPSTQAPSASGAVAITTPVVETPLPESEARQRYLEIRDARTREVVAILEVLSPTNKAHGAPRREAFLRKREAVMASGTHWIEIDLLRGGERPPDVRRPSDYYALLKRAGVEAQLEVWYFDLRDALPVIAVPLRPPFEDAPLALTSVLDETYADGFYADKLDYAGPVPPRLRPADAAWAEAQVHAWTASRV